MAYRKRISRAKSRRSFRKGSGVHPKNTMGRPMRGGIRL